jgi:hypothetical protein
VLVNFKTILKEEEKLNPLVSRFKAYIAKPCVANGYTFTKEVLSNENLMMTIPSSPVVASFVDCTDGSRLGGHSGDLVRTKKGLKRSPLVQGIGFCTDKEPWWEEYQGEEWLTCFCNIWTDYFDGLKNLSDRNIFQSMEIQLETDKDGNKVVTECYLNALCMLEGVKPAFDGSTFEEVTFSKSNYSDQITKLQKELNDMNKYSDIDFSIPENVKNFSLEVINSGEKLTSVCKSNLEFLSNNNHISPEKISYMQKYFSKIHDKTTFSSSNEDVILNWCNKLIGDMKTIDRNINFSNALSSDLADANHSDIDDKKDLSKKEGENEKMTKFTKTQKEEFAAKFSLTANQVKDLINEAVSEFKFERNGYTGCKYWIIDFDDSYAYGYDEENGGHIAIPFSVGEDGKIMIDIENIKHAKSLTVWVVEDSETFEETEDDDMYMSAVNEKCSKTEEMCNSKMSEVESKLTDTEAKLGMQFAAVTSLETALADEKLANETRQAEIDKLSAELKAKDDEQKMSKSKELMSKKEFSVFNPGKKAELLEYSKNVEFSDFETHVYAELGKFASTNLEFDEQNGKFSYMYVPAPETKKEIKDDVYAETRKKFGKSE